MRLIALLNLAFCACTSPAHAAELTVQTREITGKNAHGQAYASGQMTTPLVKPSQANNPAAAKAAKKINDRLAFMDLQGTESQQFTVSRNDARILTIAFQGEGCGAYCENFNAWYSFDVQDGSLLTAANLFTPQGLRALAVRLRQEQITRFRQQLAELRKSLKATQAKPTRPTTPPGKTDPAQQDIIIDLQDRIALNQSCLNDQIARGKEAASQQQPTLFDYAGNSPFEITDKAFKLTAGRCSNHAMRALDDVGDVVLSLPYPGLAAGVTAYGKAVLLNGSNALPAERLYGQVLYGSLRYTGTTSATATPIPVTMLIEKNTDNSLSGSYFYDRFRAPIALRGSLTGQVLALNESGDAKPGNPAADANFTLRRTGNELRGQWTSKAANKQFDIRLAP